MNFSNSEVMIIAISVTYSEYLIILDIIIVIFNTYLFPR